MATATKSGADFNLRLLEMVRDNTNSAFDFARRLIAVTSPTEFLELSVAHMRRRSKASLSRPSNLQLSLEK